MAISSSSSSAVDLFIVELILSKISMGTSRVGLPVERRVVEWKMGCARVIPKSTPSAVPSIYFAPLDIVAVGLFLAYESGGASMFSP